MQCGSKFVWVSNEDEEYTIEAPITENLWNDDDLNVNTNASPFSAPQAPPPPIPSGPKVRRTYRAADTNVVSIDFATLAKEVTVSTGDALYCESCKAVLNACSKLEKSKDDEGLWKCEFCGHHNHVHCFEEEIPKAESVDYIVGAPSETSTTNDSDIVIFCIDISGSMCTSYELEGNINLRGNEKIANLAALNTERNALGHFADQRLPNERRNITYISRLQCVQAAISAEITRMHKENPNRKVGIVTFNNEVTIIGDGIQQSQIVAGDRLYNYNELMTVGNQFQVATTVKDSAEALTKKLFSLEESGSTALGPALVVSVGMCSNSRGSKIIVCTDGLANTGLGSMEGLVTDEEQNAASKFYEDIGLYAQSKGINVSVISIKGSDCNIENLGQVAEATSGAVNRVNPLDIAKDFHTILSSPVIATHVSAKLLLHKGLFIRSEESQQSFEIKDVGNVTAETTITFEYGVRKNANEFKELKELPFQVQILFTRLDGMTCMRVISRLQPITESKEQAEEEADVAVLGQNAAQQCAQLASKGDYTQARMYNLSQKTVLKKVAKSDAQRKEVEKWERKGRHLETVLSTAQKQEVMEGVHFEDDEDEAKSDKAEKKRSLSSERHKYRKNKRSDSLSTMLYQMKNKVWHDHSDEDFD